MNRAVPLIAISTLFTPLVGACGGARATVETAAANILIPPAEEKQLGVQIHDQLSKEVRFLNDPVVTAYTKDITNQIFAVARRDSPDLAVDVYVIDDPKTVNAFATAGRQMYVFTGLLQTAQSDAEIAGVLGHETGHIVAQHPARQMVDAYGLETLASLVLGKNPSLLKQIGANVAVKGFLLANSRSDETAADEYGARYASAAGFDPGALARFLARISQKSGEPSGIAAWLSDHPTTPDRVAHLKEYIAANHLSGTRDGNRLNQIKVALRNAGAPATRGIGGGAGGSDNRPPPSRKQAP
jgi:beta-barrel assembly-enhancing protease